MSKHTKLGGWPGNGAPGVVDSGTGASLCPPAPGTPGSSSVHEKLGRGFSSPWTLNFQFRGTSLYQALSCSVPDTPFDTCPSTATASSRPTCPTRGWCGTPTWTSRPTGGQHAGLGLRVFRTDHLSLILLPEPPCHLVPHTSSLSRDLHRNCELPWPRRLPTPGPCSRCGHTPGDRRRAPSSCPIGRGTPFPARERPPFRGSGDCRWPGLQSGD